MAIMGWGTFAAFVASWVDKLIPSKKAATVDTLNILLSQYDKALSEGRDTDAAIIRKQIDELRKKINYTNGDI